MLTKKSKYFSVLNPLFYIFDKKKKKERERQNAIAKQRKIQA